MRPPIRSVVATEGAGLPVGGAPTAGGDGWGGAVVEDGRLDLTAAGRRREGTGPAVARAAGAGVAAGAEAAPGSSWL